MTTLLATVITAIIGIGGTLLVQHFSYRRQVKQWVLENKKAEYSELLSVLSKSIEQMVQNSSDVGYMDVAEAEKGRAFDEAVVRGRAVIRSRVLIAARMDRDRILEQWQMVGAMASTGERSHKWAEIRYALLEGMGKELGFKTNIPKPL
jgi:hypothetical protein